MEIIITVLATLAFQVGMCIYSYRETNRMLAKKGTEERYASKPHLAA